MSELNEIQCEKASRLACPIVSILKARVRELEAVALSYQDGERRALFDLARQSGVVNKLQDRVRELERDIACRANEQDEADEIAAEEYNDMQQQIERHRTYLEDMGRCPDCFHKIGIMKCCKEISDELL